MPDHIPNTQLTAEEYRQIKVDLMNTETGKRIAEERHRVMETFLDDFMREWEMSHRYVNEGLDW